MKSVTIVGLLAALVILTLWGIVLPLLWMFFSDAIGANFYLVSILVGISAGYIIDRATKVAIWPYKFAIAIGIFVYTFLVQLNFATFLTSLFSSLMEEALSSASQNMSNFPSFQGPFSSPPTSTFIAISAALCAISFLIASHFLLKEKKRRYIRNHQK